MKKQQVLLQALSQTFMQIPFNQLLGLKLDQLNKDQVIMNFSMKNELIGNYLQGILHGGVISSVLDMAGGMITMANVIMKHQEKTVEELASILAKCSTIDLQISFLNPGRGDVFIAKAWCTKIGKKINFSRMELTNQDEILIATGNGTYLIT